MEYQVKVVRDTAGLAALEDAWTQLLNRSQASTIFSSFPWIMAWWRAFGHSNRLYTLVITDPTSDQITGIAPLMLRRAGALRKLEYIGTGLSDTGDFVLDANCAEPISRAIFAYLRAHNTDWDILDLDETPAYSPLATLLEEEAPEGLRVISLPRTDCPYIALPATWEEYTRTLHRKSRQHLESFARRVVDETGAFFRLVTQEEDAIPAVDRFYRLHMARWASKDDALNPEHRSPAFLPFLEDVCKRSAAHGLLRLCELCVGDDVIASWISFQVNGRWNGYMTGFDPTWSNKRPGKILHGFVVRAALAEKTRELDFGRGAEEYKYEMGAVNRRNSRFILTGNAPGSLVGYGWTRLRMKARDWVHAYRARTASKTTTEQPAEPK